MENDSIINTVHTINRDCVYKKDIQAEKKSSFCLRVSFVNPRQGGLNMFPVLFGMMQQQALESSPPPLSHGNISSHPYKKRDREG